MSKISLLRHKKKILSCFPQERLWRAVLQIKLSACVWLSKIIFKVDFHIIIIIFLTILYIVTVIYINYTIY